MRCFDLTLLSKYHYYTGVIFKGYTYGTGEAVATGGRYDNLLLHFGKEAAAIGFMIQIDAVMDDLTVLIEENGGDKAASVFFLLFFQKRVVSADRIGFQSGHRSASV